MVFRIKVQGSSYKMVYIRYSRSLTSTTILVTIYLQHQYCINIRDSLSLALGAYQIISSDTSAMGSSCLAGIDARISGSLRRTSMLVQRATSPENPQIPEALESPSLPSHVVVIALGFSV